MTSCQGGKLLFLFCFLLDNLGDNFDAGPGNPHTVSPLMLFLFT